MGTGLRMHTAKIFENKSDEDLDADFEKSFGRTKCIERTSRFEENTSKCARHSIRTRHKTNSRSEVFWMRGTTTNHIRKVLLSRKDLGSAVKIRILLPRLNLNGKNGRTSSCCSYPSLVNHSSCGGAEAKMIRDGEE